MLHHFFLQKREKYAAKIKGQTLKQRAQELLKLRTADGCICELRAEIGAPLILLEHHNPAAELGRLYPSVAEMETRMLEALLRADVIRVANEFSVEFQCQEQADGIQDEFRLES